MAVVVQACQEVANFTDTWDIESHDAVSYEFLSNGWRFIDRASVNFSIDLLTVDYHDFRDLRVDALVGEEPLYVLEADIVQVFFSIWY